MTTFTVFNSFKEAMPEKLHKRSKTIFRRRMTTSRMVPVGLGVVLQKVQTRRPARFATHRAQR